MDYSRQFLFLVLLMLFCQRQTDLLFVYSLDITFQMERMRRGTIQKSLRWIFVCTKSIDISLCLLYGIRYRLFASESRLNASIHTTKFMAKIDIQSISNKCASKKCLRWNLKNSIYNIWFFMSYFESSSARKHFFIRCLRWKYKAKFLFVGPPVEPWKGAKWATKKVSLQISAEERKTWYTIRNGEKHRTFDI